MLDRLGLSWRTGDTEEREELRIQAPYGEYEITVEISSGIVTGHFPRRALKAVLEWYEMNKEALQRDWELAEQRKPLEPIQPLESWL